MKIAILLENSKTEELGIKSTAEQLGIDLSFIPFRKVSICLNETGYSFKTRGKNFSRVVDDCEVVLNRAQSKNRRLYAATILEAFGKYVINPLSIEAVCFSKFKTVLRFWKEGIKTPKTVYIPCDVKEFKTDGSKISNEKDICDLIHQDLMSGGVVVKPDSGSHGNKVLLAKKQEELIPILRETETSIINPIGILAQTFVQKWFYDLRIIVAKESGRPPYCYQKALARAGYKDFRTNTYLGNLAFGVTLPACVRENAIKCGNAIGRNSKAWVIALDAMPDIGDDKIADDQYVKKELDKLRSSFNAIKKIKSEKSKERNFVDWNRRLENAFQHYKNQRGYEKIQTLVEESLERNRYNVLFHEANSCPEFWEQTRLIAGVNLAVPLLKCAQSIIETKDEQLYECRKYTSTRMS